ELGAGFDFDLVTTARGQREGYRTGSNRTFGEEGLRKTAADGTTSVLPLVPADTLVSFSEFLALSGRARLGYTLTSQWRVDLAADAFRSEGVQNPGDLNVVDFDPRSLKDVSRHSFDLALEGSLARHSPTVRLFHARETVDYF